MKLRCYIKAGAAGESGQALILVLILLVLGSLMVVPLMNFMTTGVKTGVVYTKKSAELYAADAGVQDAIWQVKYDQLETDFTSPPYNLYDYATTWSYNLAAQVNARDVGVSIDNVWIPKDIPAPGEGDAEAIIETGKLIVTGSAVGEQYTIKISYTPELGENLIVDTLGIWLPLGFSYVTGSSNLEADPFAEYYSVPVVEPHAGNQAVLWRFSSVPFSALPGVDTQESPMVAEVSFQFATADSENALQAVAWIETSGVSDIPYSWDADTRVYKITSQAGATTVESYFAKEELRRLRSAIAGDYKAIGNSLMIDTNHDLHGVRDMLLSSSQIVVSTIPPDADVAAAFLYWSAWRDEDSKEVEFFDACSSFVKWVSGSSWNIYYERFRSHYSSGGESDRYLTLKTSLPLGYCLPSMVEVSWDQYEGGTLESDDGLDFAFSGDGGGTWSSLIASFRDDIGSSPTRFRYTVPAQYLTDGFKIRFRLQGFSGSSEYCYLDNITVSVMVPDASVVFKIDGQQVYFDGDGEPQQGAQELTASRSQILPNLDYGTPHGYSYSCYRDVTEIVKAYSAKAPDPELNHPGNGTYSVGSVTGDTGDEWSYAGWSLIIIYTSAQTQGHRMYLYDDFIYANHDLNVDFDKDGEPGGHISGFIVPKPIAGELNVASLTVFVGEGDECYTGDRLIFNDDALSNGQSPSSNVWNSKSPGLTADGVDIDTFDVSWDSELLVPGDASAQIDLPTDIDIWNLIYIIISFRNESTTGGHLSYLIRG